MDKWNPNQYEKFKTERAKPFWDLLNMVQAVEKPRIVDLGCGTGELTQKLHERMKAASTLGIDSSTNMLQQAKSCEGDNLKFEQFDISSFNPKEKFDLVFSNAALQWVPDHEGLYPKMFGSLAEGGQIAIQMPCNFDHASHQIAAEVALTLFPHIFGGKARPSNVLGVERYSEILYQHGFADQNCLIRVYAHPMPSGLSVVEWTKGTLLTAYEAKLGKEDFAKYLQEYSKELISVIGEGPYFYGFKRMLLWGKRA